MVVVFNHSFVHAILYTIQYISVVPQLKTGRLHVYNIVIKRLNFNSTSSYPYNVIFYAGEMFSVWMMTNIFKVYPTCIFDTENLLLWQESALLKSKNQHITKQGWLYKGPDSGHESSIISFTRVGNVYKYPILSYCILSCVRRKIP